MSGLSASIRETDVIGWQKNGSIIGIIFTEIIESHKNTAKAFVLNKLSNALSNSLNLEQTKKVRIFLHLFPEECDGTSPSEPDPSLYPDLVSRTESKKFSLLIKRTVDVAGAILGLIILAPLFLIISLLIRLSSRGPILFRQQRIGQFGRRFNFLKFRSMYRDCEHDIHREYVKQLIAGGEGYGLKKFESATNLGVYKITHDPRITPIGRFLRKTSLDELPQLWNVLKGEMSLVGPRPPIPYEFDSYDNWHKRRVLEAKPGLTGLWQVNGRSRITFDEMVRLDLKYVRMWSLWLDFKILLKTPWAVLIGAGAY
jgi:lipopolysaccharide/colanic/teichoic acid biosynthesis glycosyltransferase